MEVAYKVGNSMVRERKNTEEYLNPWAGEAGWKTDPRQFNVISGAHAQPRRRYTGGPRNVKKSIPKKSFFPFNWLQVATLILGIVAITLMAALLNIVLA